MIIHASGPYDSDGGDVNDADRILAQFTRLLDDAGHTISSATLVTGSRIRNTERDHSGGYVLTEAPVSEPGSGLDPAVADPAGVQAEHDAAVAARDEVLRERETAAERAEADAVSRHRDAAADRAGQDETVREHLAGIREDDNQAAREQDEAGRDHPRYAAGGVIPPEAATDEAARRRTAGAASAVFPSPPPG